jgi:transposase
MLQSVCCRGCLSKMVEIDRLKADRDRLRRENARLKRKLGKAGRTIREAPFGSSTPSAKLPVKPNSKEADRGKMGGARHGHKGHGRRGAGSSGADALARRIRGPAVCPDCGGPMHSKGTRERLVVDCEPMRRTETVYKLERRKCPRCGRRADAEAPEVLPKCLYGNRLLAFVASEHYLHGTTLGRLESRTGIGCGSLVDALHQLARRLEPLMPRLVADYRAANVRRADETTWRENGLNGYAWLFAAMRTSIFRFRVTRSSEVPAEVLGPKPLPGVLVVDRYAAYNIAPCDLQYCFAHLLRDVGDLGTEFPDDPQVAAFVEALAPELAAAMSLRGLDISDEEYLRRARKLRDSIVAIAQTEANHPGVQNLQSIFRENARRLYHWAEDRNVPAHNNDTERELRPLVIARKLSFGSQSPRGRHTREVLMSVLHTLRKRTPDPPEALCRALNALARDPKQDIGTLLLGPKDNP